MGELIGGLIALLVWILIIPIVIVAVVLSLAFAGVGIALAAVGIVLHLFFQALPFLLVLGLVWLIFRPSTRQAARH